MLALAGVSIATSAGALAAQDRGASKESLQPGQRILVASRGERLSGEFVRGAGESTEPRCDWIIQACAVVLANADATFRIPRERIDSLWVEGRAVGKGAGIGAIAVGAASALAMAWACRSHDRDHPGSEFSCGSGKGLVAAVTIGGAAGAAGGAILGGLAGWFAPVWKLRFVSPF